MVMLESRPAALTPRQPEYEFFEPRDIALATSTFYKNWRPSQEGQRTSTDSDGIRGDLALRTLTLAKQNGFQIAVFDDGSSKAFQRELRKVIGKRPTSNKNIKGMSPGRRQAFREAAGLEEVKIIAWTEPEKVSMANSENLRKAAVPILRDEADVVIPKRDTFAFLTYPDYQVRSEQDANHKFNAILKQHGLLPQEAEELDVWFGPRLFRNDPDILTLFTHQWEIDNKHQAC